MHQNQIWVEFTEPTCVYLLAILSLIHFYMVHIELVWWLNILTQANYGSDWEDHAHNMPQIVWNYFLGNSLLSFFRKLYFHAVIISQIPFDLRGRSSHIFLIELVLRHLIVKLIILVVCTVIKPVLKIPQSVVSGVIHQILLLIQLIGRQVRPFFLQPLPLRKV